MQYSNTISSVPGQSNVWCIDISNKRSSLIRRIEWEEGPNILSVYLKYKDYPDKYENVSRNHFEEFSSQNSIGKYYLHFIKPNFKQIKKSSMSDSNQPKGINIAKNEVRWIDISLDVQKINKDWLVPGTKGVYLNVRLRMLPDGEVDKYECLGFIVQNVPSKIYKEAEAKEKGSGKKIEGIILGNAKELDWGNRNTEGLPGQQGDSLGITDEIANDLPF